MTFDCFYIVTGSQITPEGKGVLLELERGFTVQWPDSPITKLTNSSVWMRWKSEERPHLFFCDDTKSQTIEFASGVHAPIQWMSSVHSKHIVEAPLCSTFVCSEGQVGVMEQEKKKSQETEWVAERIRRKDKTEEWIMRNAQWDTWSWCHSSAKVGVISQETKLVFIVSLRAKRVVGKSRKWAMKGAPERWESTWFVSKL